MDRRDALVAGADALEDVYSLAAAPGAKVETGPAIHAPTPPVSAADIDKLAADRLAAYERLNLWYTDWSQVFRDELGYHQLVRLGLVAVGSSASGTPESPAEPTPSTP